MAEDRFDVLVIGAGPAGLTAGLYASRAGLKTAIVEKGAPGGQIATTDLVDNYPGFPEGILGPDLSQLMEKQAVRFGSQLIYDEVTGLKPREDGSWEATMYGGAKVARTVIVASGAYERKLGAPGEDRFRGRGVSYCAICDGAFFKGGKVAVVGGGDSALTEGLYLTRVVEEVTIIHRRDEPRAAYDLQQRAKANPKIRWILSHVVEGMEGDDQLRRLILRSTKDGSLQELQVDGVFIYIGMVPNTGFLAGVVERDEAGYILATPSLQTSAPGIWVAGDARAGSLAQVSTAVGEGAIAALEAEAYLGRWEAGQKPPWPRLEKVTL
ncbi:MAG: thioredoxin-disulfide reductase [Bacillota bacterium]|nr:thioredoxin-disulfide reductase [Bacillota bacterium]